MKSGTCPKCGALKVLQDVPVRANVAIGSGRDAQLNVELTEPADPHKRIQSIHTERFTFRAWICPACGYTEFYVHDGAKFHETYEKGWTVALD
jgi:predicted nucleic-acid-binding Zn-ribbon protein